MSHGSRSRKSREEVDALAARLTAKLTAAAGPAGPDSALIFESAFLDVETPSIPEGLETCVRRGATRITVLLNFLNSGKHVLADVPAAVRAFECSHPGVTCVLTPHIGSHPALDSLYLDLIKK